MESSRAVNKIGGIGRCNATIAETLYIYKIEDRRICSQRISQKKQDTTGYKSGK